MNVDFNNLRKQALYSYHRLTERLNENIKEDTLDGRLNIDPDEIQEEMDNLRMLLLSIALVYEEGDEAFKDVSEEARPIAWFNEQEED